MTAILLVARRLATRGPPDDEVRAYRLQFREIHVEPFRVAVVGQLAAVLYALDVLGLVIAHTLAYILD
jgi:hypothetical protein